MRHIELPYPSTTERNRLLNRPTLRGQTLDRLYERRYALNELIRCLENYQQARQSRSVELMEFVSSTGKGFATVARKCS
jgi:hypothetical protein